MGRDHDSFKSGMNIIDKTEIKHRFGRSVESYDNNAHVQKIIIEKLCRLLKEWCPEMPAKVLEVGCGTGLLTENIIRDFSPNHLVINDLVDTMCIKTACRCGLSSECCMEGDIEELTLRNEFELILSASTFQWFTRPEETFARLASALVPEGWLLFSTFGKNNLSELRTVAGAGLVYYSREELADLLAPHFDILHTEESLHTLYFTHPLEILQHLKKTGVNSGGNSAGMWTKGRINKFVEGYINAFSENKRLPLSYHPIYFVCRKKSC